MSISELLANAITGDPGANAVISQGLAGAPVPLVTLNADPCDGFLADCSTPAVGSALLGSSGPTLNSLLASQQQALLGCGGFYGTNVGSNCEATGVALLNSEASGWFQCLTDGDPNWDYGDPDVPQPCTVGFQSGPVCTRFANGQTLILPGCRGPDDPGYDPDVDGTTTDLLHPLTGQQFSSELAALSYNTSMLLVALSTPVDPSQPAEDEFDPTDPQRLDGCSFRKPQLCGNVRSLFTFPGTLTTEAEDDPSGPPQRRWVWETGADYEITSAGGSLADFDGWSFHALGPEVSRVEASDLGVQFVLGPPEPCVPPGPVPTSILIRVGIGTDGIPDNGDGCVIGLAYGVVPEPSALLSGGSAGAVLAFLARWRTRRPVRGL